MKRLMIAICLVMAIADAAAACGRCGYSVCRFQYPVKYHTSQPYNYTDQRLQVTYNISAPVPAAAGSTIYQYQQQYGGYAQLDPAAWLNASTRHLEQAQITAQKGFSEFNQSAAIQFAAQAGLAELQLSNELYNTLLKFKQPLLEGQSVTIRAHRGADGRMSLEHVPAPPGATGDASGFLGLMRKACADCHRPGGRKPEPDLSDLTSLDLGRWGADIIYRVNTSNAAEAMPPPGGVKLSDQEKQEITTRFVEEMRRIAKESSGPPARGPAAPVPPMKE